jgi:DNA-binding GntR family transcriptional regulator
MIRSSERSFGLGQSSAKPSPLVKDQLAAFLREEIIGERLNPGDRIVEGKWAARLKVAQASIREALNTLASEGFVQKEGNRSARVTELNDDDVAHIFQVRGALEGLAAYLVAAKRPDFSEMEQTIADMRSAAECNNMRAFYDRDVRFHLLLCENSGNNFLLEHVKRLVVPLFAFVVIRLGGATKNPADWMRSVEEHRQILDALRTGDPIFAEAHMARSIRKFSNDLRNVLEQKATRTNQTLESVAP